MILLTIFMGLVLASPLILITFLLYRYYKNRKPALGGSKKEEKAPEKAREEATLRRKKVLGILSMGFGGFMLLGFLSNTQKGSLAEELVSLILFVGVPLLNGVFLLRKYYRDQKKALEEKERALKARKAAEIIRLAQRKRGRLTVTEVVAETSLDMAEAEKILQEMVTRGYIGLKITDSGLLVYEFHEMTREDKDAAKGILE